MDQELEKLLHVCWADAACALTRWQHFSARNYLFVDR